MSLKIQFTCFFFFFVIYLGINLLMVKLGNSNYIDDNALGILKSNKKFRIPAFRKNRFNNVSVMEQKGETNIEATVHKERVENVSIDLKDNKKIRQQISEACKENNLTTTIVKRNFLYSSEHKGVYCWIRKAGSTSFTKIFSHMNSRTVLRDYYREIEFLAPKNEKLLIDLVRDSKVFKLLVVRHPFERLVSAYRDRIEDNSKYTAQSWIYVPKIFHVTRPELFKSSGAIDDSLIKIFYEDKRLKLIPSFSEFVKWLLQQDSIKDDPHWNQYHKHCALCTIQYDYILKLDNFTKHEIDYIFSQMNLNKNITYLFKLEQAKKGNTNFDETCNYFKNLTREAVVDLYERYRIDFDMFNYEFDKYFECTDGD